MSEITAFMGGVTLVLLWLFIAAAIDAAEDEQAQMAAHDRIQREFR